MDLDPLLRPHRKALVLAAEHVISGTQSKMPDKSQLNRLVSICGEATCAEEIANYLRYQASRPRTSWTHEFAASIIAEIEKLLPGITQHLQPEADSDRAKIAAWRLYAVFLVRAFTYVKACENGNGHARR